MKKIFSFILCGICLTGCASTENPDQDFNNFYQGSPDNFVFTGDETAGLAQEKTATFQLNGADGTLQCSIKCAPVSQ